MADQSEYVTKNVVLYPHLDATVRNYATLHDLNYSQALRVIISQWKAQNAPKAETCQEPAQ